MSAGKWCVCARVVLTIVSYVMPNPGHTYILGDDLSLIEGYCLEAYVGVMLHTYVFIRCV